MFAVYAGVSVRVCRCVMLHVHVKTNTQNCARVSFSVFIKHSTLAQHWSRYTKPSTKRHTHYTLVENYMISTISSVFFFCTIWEWTVQHRDSFSSDCQLFNCIDYPNFSCHWFCVRRPLLVGEWRWVPAGARVPRPLDPCHSGPPPEVRSSVDPADCAPPPPHRVQPAAEEHRWWPSSRRHQDCEGSGGPCVRSGRRSGCKYTPSTWCEPHRRSRGPAPSAPSSGGSWMTTPGSSLLPQPQG